MMDAVHTHNFSASYINLVITNIRIGQFNPAKSTVSVLNIICESALSYYITGLVKKN